MKLTIIAPTGGVGRHLLAQALDAGHDVTAVARNPAKLPPDVLAAKNARIITGDLAAPGAERPDMCRDATDYQRASTTQIE